MSAIPSFSSVLIGTCIDTCTMPGSLPISTAPVITTLFSTSSTLTLKSLTALSNPLLATSFIVDPEPITWLVPQGSALM